MTTLVHLSISKLRMKYQSIVGVLGNVQVVASPNYEVVESRRRIYNMNKTDYLKHSEFILVTGPVP